MRLPGSVTLTQNALASAWPLICGVELGVAETLCTVAQLPSTVCEGNPIASVSAVPAAGGADVSVAGSILVSVTSTSPGTGTLNGCESVPRIETVPVNVSTTVGGANDPGCVGTGVDATSPLHAAVRTMTPSTGNNLFIPFMLLEHAP